MFPQGIKILIVDDMAMFRQMVKQALVELGYKNYVEATDGSKAWSEITGAREKGDPFGLIISDWTMPNMKGIDLLKKVRASGWGLHLPFVLLTGEAEKEFIIEAIKSGVTQYIIKPFTVDSLQKKLKATYDKVATTSPNIVITNE